MSERENPDGERGFTIVDRRASAGADAGAPPVDPSRGPSQGDVQAPPRMDFAMLVHSIAVAVLHHLGIAPDPDGGKHAPDLVLAQQNIEILEVLAEKTRGNLDDEERRLLEGLLYEVRMRFVEASKAGGA
jgi:hypothetical protein